MSVVASIAKYSKLPVGAVKEWVPGELEEIDASILFVMASWSGQSLAAFIKLTARLADERVPPPLLVCDIDDLSPTLTRRLGQLRGAGETFWIRDGQIVAMLADYEQDDWPDRVSQYNQALRP